jgi:hypothetical protein
MSDNADQPDAYYGEEDSTNDLDLSFLDDQKPSDDSPSK